MNPLHHWKSGLPLLVIVGFLFPSARAGMAQAPGVNRFTQREEATLEELLTSGLKVRTASEKAFIAKVAKTVEEGKLSESMVKALYQRSVSQRSRYPLPYFTAMIQKLAKQRGVDL